jgi:hypothetical protein
MSELPSDFEFYVKGKKIIMNEFVRNVIHDVIVGIVSHLHDVDLKTIEKVEIS